MSNNENTTTQNFTITTEMKISFDAPVKGGKVDIEDIQESFDRITSGFNSKEDMMQFLLLFMQKGLKIEVEDEDRTWDSDGWVISNLKEQCEDAGVEFDGSSWGIED